MNMQEIFDASLKLMRERGYEPALHEASGSCYYRRPDDGLPCLIGALIPDEVYDKNFEMKAADTLVESFPQVEQIFRGIPPSFLQSLQQAHDKLRSSKAINYARDFEANMRKLASDWGLTYTSPKQGASS